MNTRDENQPTWQNTHSFGQDRKKSGEARTLIVVLLTTATMVIEIVAGITYGSMALLADGLHMASHATALAISLFAYIYARRNAYDHRFCFGTGKVNSLAGFTGAVLLAMFALVMLWESGHRLIEPVSIAFDQALVVAFLGLLVNGISVAVLGSGPSHHDHEHHDDHKHDHNLRSAYLHVLADALTSVMAIIALLAGKYFGLNWFDPLMGIVGATLVARWSLGLLASTSAVLLDHHAPPEIGNAIRQNIEKSGCDRLTDLHGWSVGPGIYCVILSVVSENPQPPTYYHSLLPPDRGLVHVSIEIHDVKYWVAGDVCHPHGDANL